MKHAIRHGLAVALALTAGVALVGCSGGGSAADSVDAGTGDYSGPPVTVTFWNGFTGGNALDLVPQLIDRFEKEYPDITIAASPMQWDDLDAKMPLALKAGKGPDLAVAHGEDVATYAAQGLVLPADETLKALDYKAEDFPPNLLKAANLNGHQYGIPWSVTPLGLYVNKGVLSSAGLDPNTAPTDLASTNAALDALKAKGIQGEYVSGFRYTDGMEFESLLWQFGGELFSDDLKKSTFNSEAGVKALTYMTDKIKNGYSPENVAEGGPLKAFIASTTAFSWQGVWSSSDPALKSVDWTAVPVPQIGEKPAVRTGTTDWMFMKNKNQDKNKTAAAVTFVKWMEAHSVDWASTGELPAFNDTRNDPALLQKYPILTSFVNELDYAHYYPALPGIGNVIKLISPGIDEAILGQKTPKQALDDAAVKADQLLQRNASQYGG
jgi:multiple sugar transport system substrate-binding protein